MARSLLGPLAFTALLFLLARSGLAQRVTMTPTLLDDEPHRLPDQAIIQVAVTGVELHYPPARNGTAQAHLDYQLDNGPIIHTAETQMTFSNLSPGRHLVRVRLMGADHEPLSPREVLVVDIR